MNDFSPVNEINELKEGGVPLDIVIKENEQTNLDELTCPICYNLVWCPTDCSNCGNLFCLNCINKALQISNTCPMCKQSPFDTTQCKALAKLFKNIRLKCSNESCTANPEYSDFITHQKKCPFRLYKCINDGCNYKNIINNEKQMKEHSTTCQHKIIKCNYCRMRMKRMHLTNHINNNCPQLIKCPSCHKIMTKTNYFFNYHNHYNSIECLHYQIDYHKNQIKVNNENNAKTQEKLKKEIQDKNNEIEKVKKECQDLNEKILSLINEKEKLLQKENQSESLDKPRFLLRKRKKEQK